MTKTIAKILVTTAISMPFAVMAEPLPKPVEGLECLVGSWKGAGTMTMGKDKAKVDATWECKRTAARWGVTCNFRVTGIPGGGAYEETDLMGYEPNSNTFHWFAVTNAGETHDHVATASDASKIQFVYNGTQEGKPLKEVIEFEMGKDSKSFSGRAETFVAGASTSVLTLAMRK
jgi:hypothetical protein